MKVSDYIVSVLQREGVTDVFGIPGVGCGHFTDSLRKSVICNHLTYHEQGAAFAACAYSQAAGSIGVAYATAGPGATNLLTGIANAYVDSVPTLYIVGDKDLGTLRSAGMDIRQRASQEVDIVAMACPITKWSYQIRRCDEVRHALEKALYIARNGRPGPVLLDIPSDIQRMEYIDQPGYAPEESGVWDVRGMVEAINRSTRPLFLVGGGTKQATVLEQIKKIAEKANIPVAATVVCDDELFNFDRYLGFIGVDGDACANAAVAACDLLVCMGTRLNIKEVGQKRSDFAPQAHIIRIDIDAGELGYRLRDEETMQADLKEVVPALLEHASEIEAKKEWITGSGVTKMEKSDAAATRAERFAAAMPKDIDISLGIGTHRRLFIASRVMKSGWRIFQSAGLASMGYALPAAIGIYYAAKRPVICIDGDGGLLMNLQELQLIRRDNLPITIVVFNNRCLGEIMEFQKKIFGGNYYGTTEETGYQAADFKGLAAAFHLGYTRLESNADISAYHFDLAKPSLVEVIMPMDAGRESHEAV